MTKVDAKQWRRARGEYTKTLSKNTDFNPDDYLKYLARTFKTDKKPPIDLFFHQPNAYRQSLYPETAAILTALKKSHRLGIFSEGFRKFQLTKLKHAGLLPFFDPKLIFIRRWKFTNRVLNQIPAGAVIIDDSLEVIEAVSSDARFTPVWLNRKDKTRRLHFPTIHCLNDLIVEE